MRQTRLKRYSVRRNIKAVAIVVISFAIITGCSGTAQHETKLPALAQEQSIKSVKAAKIFKQKIADPIEHSADVESSVQLDILSKANGTISQILKKRGDKIKEGEVLVKLVSADAKLQKEKADLAVKVARDALTKAKRENGNAIQKAELGLSEVTRSYNKMRNDYDSGLVTQEQLDQAEAQLNNAQLDFEQLKQRLNISDTTGSLTNTLISQRQVNQDMANLEIRAPGNGVLTEMPIEVGMSLQSGTKIGVIQKLDPIIIVAQLNDEDAKLVRSKTEVTYYVQGNTQMYRGKISYLADIIDPQTKTYELDLEVPNRNMDLKPGMKLRILLTEEQELNVITVPTYSVLTEGENTFVFVLKGDTAEKRRVQLGRINEPYQEVINGIKEGELVLVSGLNQLKDKEKVRVTAVEGQ